MLDLGQQLVSSLVVLFKSSELVKIEGLIELRMHSQKFLVFSDSIINMEAYFKEAKTLLIFSNL